MNVEERTKRIAQALYNAGWDTPGVCDSLGQVCDTLAPLIERAIEAALWEQLDWIASDGDIKKGKAMNHWKAALSVLEGQTP